MNAEPNKKSKRILIMAGGTGGHVFPGLAVAEKLKSLGHQITWLGSVKGLEKQWVPKHNIPIHYLSVTGLRGSGMFRWLMAPWVLLRALWQAVLILRRENPDVVLGMGGFASGPGGVAARFLRKPLVIHEQNAVAGLTNRCLARYCATSVLAAFPDSFKREPLRSKVKVVGNPLRASFHPKQECSVTHPLHVLVLGGSRGARTLNQTVPLAVAQSLPGTIKLWHQTGEALYQETHTLYQPLSLDARVVPFIEDMNAAYQWADLVIARAGALTVAEISTVGVASLLIPYPHAVDDHQTHNARYLVEANAALMLSNEQCTPDIVGTFLRTLSEQPERLTAMAIACAPLRQSSAADKVANCCNELIT